MVYSASAQGVTQVNTLEESLLSVMQGYVVRDHAKVREFLRRYPFLVPTLADARRHIAEYFPDSQLSLWVMLDPERDSDDDADELVLSIETTLDVPQAAERRERLADDWWLDALPETQSKLSVDVEFV